MTLPQDVAALLAAAGVADATYQDFSNERFAQERDASPWRLLRGIAMPGEASEASGPKSAGLTEAGIEDAKRSTARDDAFVVPSFAPRAKRSTVNEDSLVHAAPFMQPLQALAQDLDEPLAGDQARRPAEIDRHREGPAPRLSLRAQRQEESQASETLLERSSREEPLSSVLQRVSPWR